MAQRLNVDICVIGGGSGGLSVAAGASQLGAKVALIEKGLMGGDCLNYGCVPSKALLAAGKAAYGARQAGRFGVRVGDPAIDRPAVRQHVRDVIASIAPHDSVERFEGLGVHVIQAAAEFHGPREIRAGDMVIETRRSVIATGSSPMVPPVPGLADVPFLTNETVFDQGDDMPHLIIIGGGPIGLEMAQAHRRLGSRVTVLEMFNALPKDDPELAAVVLRQLRHEGIEILEQTKVVGVGHIAGGITVQVENAAGGRQIEGTHLLVAAGRKANVEGLNLEAAGVEYSPRGVKVDARLRTTNRRIFAIGDVAGGLQFTHVAGYHAGIVLRNALFRLPAKADHSAVPWVTYTDPELAHIGLDEQQARERFGKINVLRWPYVENDRARAERQTEGFLKVVTRSNGRIVGATAAGHHAGELILPWVMAVSGRMKIARMAGIIAPYPTLSEVSKRAAGSFFVPKLFSDRTRRLVRLLGYLG